MYMFKEYMFAYNELLPNNHGLEVSREVDISRVSSASDIFTDD